MMKKLATFDLGERSTPNPRRTELQAKQRGGNITPQEKAELQGIYAFPNNPRGAELQMKKVLGGISEQELIELQALRAFRNDPRGAELRQKQALGTINPAEAKELARKYQQKNDSPEVSKLRDSIENGDTNIEKVDMNDGKSVEVMADDEDEKIIWTEGLGGCYGTLVFCEDENGNRRAVLTHYDPTNISSNMRKLQDLVDKNPAMKSSKTKQTVFILAADDVESDKKSIDVLELTIKATLGDNVDIKIEPYSTKQESGVKDWGAFIVRIPPTKKGDAHYRTWYNQGKLGKSDEEKVAEIKKSLLT